MKRIANFPVRNIASWAGNIMIAHNHGDFTSDLYPILLGAGATLTVGSSSGIQSGINMTDFITFGMYQKIINSVTIPFLRQNEYFKTYKVSLRHQNSHAIVNAAVRPLFSRKN